MMRKCKNPNCANTFKAHHNKKFCEDDCRNAFYYKPAKKLKLPKTKMSQRITADRVNKFIRAGYSMETIGRIFGEENLGGYKCKAGRS